MFWDHMIFSYMTRIQLLRLFFLFYLAVYLLLNTWVNRFARRVIFPSWAETLGVSILITSVFLIILLVLDAIVWIYYLIG